MRPYLAVLLLVVTCFVAVTFRVTFGVYGAVLGMTAMLAFTLIHTRRLGHTIRQTDILRVCLLYLAISVGSVLMAVAIGLITPRQAAGLLQPAEAVALVWSGVNSMVAIICFGLTGCSRLQHDGT